MNRESQQPTDDRDLEELARKILAGEWIHGMTVYQGERVIPSAA